MGLRAWAGRYHTAGPPPRAGPRCPVAASASPSGLTHHPGRAGCTPTGMAGPPGGWGARCPGGQRWALGVARAAVVAPAARSLGPGAAGGRAGGCWWAQGSHRQPPGVARLRRGRYQGQPWPQPWPSGWHRPRAWPPGGTAGCPGGRCPVPWAPRLAYRALRPGAWRLGMPAGCPGTATAGTGRRPGLPWPRRGTGAACQDLLPTLASGPGVAGPWQPVGRRPWAWRHGYRSLPARPWHGRGRCRWLRSRGRSALRPTATARHPPRPWPVAVGRARQRVTATPG